MTDTKQLKGQRAVVTGAARGLGLAIALRLSQAGADIVAIDLPGGGTSLPAHWSFHAIDLAAEDAETMLAEVARSLDSLEILIANAGVVPPWRGIDALDRSEWDHVMRINVWGVAASIGAFAQVLEASGRGAVVAMASLNGHTAHAKQALYTASKHAVIGVVRAAALDLGPRGVRVNALAPGPVATDALAGRMAARHAAGAPSPEDALSGLARDTALGRIATQADVANAALFLACDASTGMTGTVLPVDGGLL